MLIKDTVEIILEVNFFSQEFSCCIFHINKIICELTVLHKQTANDHMIN